MSKNWHLRLVLWSRVTYKDCTFLVGVYLWIVLLLAQPPKHAAPHALRDRVWLRMGGSAIALPLNPLRSSWRKHTCYESSSATAAPCSSTVFDLSCCVRVHHDRHAEREIVPLLILSLPLCFTVSEGDNTLMWHCCAINRNKTKRVSNSKDCGLIKWL